MIVAQEKETFSVASPSAREAVEAVSTGFEEFGEETCSRDPLGWPKYEDRLAGARERSGEGESVITGEACVGETPVIIVSFDFRFLGGSMGEATGRKIVAAFERARESRRPVISLVATGGARMQEGMRSLIQMQEIADACAAARLEGIPHIGVLRDPTTGGVWASMAAIADVLIGVEGATVAFAGSRVRRSEDDGDEFTSTGKYRAGFIDMVLKPEDIPGHLETIADLLSPDTIESSGPADVPQALGRTRLPRKAWASVEHARASGRPRAEAYLEEYFEHRVEISGDRVGGRDEAMICGFGRRHGRTIAYAAQSGAANSAAGFRTARRLLDMAERFQLPVLTLIDTPGASNSTEDEREGVGTAIADLFCTVAELSVPITSLVIGEGGSGGALALAAPDNLWITPDGYFSVIAPESAARILQREALSAGEISEHMGLRPQDLVHLGVVRGIAPAKRRHAQVLQTPYVAVRQWIRNRSRKERVGA